jgi:hypothetical protein
MRTVLWALLAFGMAGLVVGCVEWIKGRGQQLALAGVPTVLLISSMLIGDSQSAGRYTLLAVAVSFSGYNLISWRRVIRWSSPVIAFAGTSILLILVIELAPGGARFASQAGAGETSVVHYCLPRCSRPN